jgi:hypothetical protein
MAEEHGSLTLSADLETIYGDRVRCHIQTRLWDFVGLFGALLEVFQASVHQCKSAGLEAAIVRRSRCPSAADSNGQSWFPQRNRPVPNRSLRTSERVSEHNTLYIDDLHLHRFSCLTRKFFSWVAHDSDRMPRAVRSRLVPVCPLR